MLLKVQPIRYLISLRTKIDLALFVNLVSTSKTAIEYKENSLVCHQSIGGTTVMHE